MARRVAIGSVLALALQAAWAVSPTLGDIFEVVSRVSQAQYTASQLAVENSGLGLYGGPSYNQGYRTRDGSASLGTLGNQEARLYLQDRFAALGMNVSVQGTYRNVIGEIPGSVHPERIFIIGAHYDTTSGGDRPGGDDNASGTAGVLEAARVLSQFRFESTLRFIAFNAEEDGLLGSKNYVLNQVIPNGENVVGMINMDMILRPGFDAQPSAVIDADLETRTNHAASVSWAQLYQQAAAAYVPGLVLDSTVYNVNGGSDQDPFVTNGYAAFMVSENTAADIWSGSNAYYHSFNDASDRLANDPNNPSGVTYDYAFATDVVRGSVALLAWQAGLMAVPEPSGMWMAGLVLAAAFLAGRGVRSRFMKRPPRG